VTVSTTVQPAKAGQLIRLERLEGRSWRTVGQGRTNRSGVASVKFRAPARPGASTMRFVTSPLPATAAAISSPFTIRVK
jgi:hypothetical protein